jgi:hypothetical protein
MAKIVKKNPFRCLPLQPEADHAHIQLAQLSCASPKCINAHFGKLE